MGQKLRCLFEDSKTTYGFDFKRVSFGVHQGTANRGFEKDFLFVFGVEHFAEVYSIVAT